MSDPRIQKLPKWAQEHISKLTRERDNATNKCQRLSESQVVTQAWVEDYGSDAGHRREYIQGDGIVVQNHGVALCIRYHKSQIGIELSWAASSDPSISCRPYDIAEACFLPTAHQQARIVHPKRLR